MKFIQLPDQARGYEDLLREVIGLRVKANKKKDEAKELEEQANSLFQGAADVAGFDAVETDVGTIRVVTKAGRASLDQDKLKDYLLKKGVDSTLVVEAFKSSTSKGQPTKYVGFFPPKGV